MELDHAIRAEIARVAVRLGAGGPAAERISQLSRSEIYGTLAALGADRLLLAVVASWGQSMDEAGILGSLRACIAQGDFRFFRLQSSRGGFMAAMGRPVKVLFVCTGNICRSPTAEGVLRHLAKQAGVEVHVESAGTGHWHVGRPPDQRAQRHAHGRGYDLSAQRARQVTLRDFEAFDLIVAMDRGHLAALQGLCPPQHRAKLRLLVPERDVPDPYYGGDQGFERVLDMVEAACAGLLREMTGATS
jgi:protein-tyrosine phosphatase